MKDWKDIRLILRYQRDYRENIDALKRVLVSLPKGGSIPLEQLGNLVIKKGPPMIKSENARPNTWVYVDIKDVDVGTFIVDAKQIIKDNLELPAGYSIKWSGQYEYMERACKTPFDGYSAYTFNCNRSSLYEYEIND